MEQFMELQFTLIYQQKIIFLSIGVQLRYFLFQTRNLFIIEEKHEQV
jgi:hypothetical protein